VNPKTILIFVRYENVYFRLSLGRKLKAQFPEARLVFATINHFAQQIILAAGEECFYVLHEIQKLSSNDLLEVEERVELEKEIYGALDASLNLIMLAERGRPSKGKKVELFLNQHLTVMHRFIGESTLTVHETWDSALYWISSGLTLARGGWNFGFISCGIPSNTVLGLRTPWTRWRLPEEAGRIPETVADMKEELGRPVSERMGYMNIGAAKKPTDWILYQSKVLRHNLIDSRHGAYYWGFKDYLPNFIGKAWRHTKRLLLPPKSTLKSAAEIQAISEKVVYFPLQMEPEASILAYSPWFQDQLEAIRITCQSMPQGYRLVVKENPKMAGSRPLNYYRKILSHPHVDIADIKIPTDVLLEKCVAVVAISGTATFEGRILGKTTFCFGRPPARKVCSDFDIAGEGQMQKWFDLLQQPAGPLSEEIFSDWKRSAFRARGSMFWQGAYRGLDASDENVDKYRDFILEVLNAPDFTTLDS